MKIVGHGERIKVIEGFAVRYKENNEKSPTIKEIAAFLNCSEEKVLESMEFGREIKETLPAS
ncbi:sigma-70 domain-containing protein [Bacillus marinisedimentorum]|uniref:sigma-70 domain-containing protein n=1 Tax=Bacillus marinisedimentorum TaxID=1821260 RepID=UPI000D08BD24|nr:sigma-70 domain-containing protein [Bacillus marinisedimentorum]